MVALSPNELMMGRKLKASNDVLRSTSVTDAGELNQYYYKPLSLMTEVYDCAERTLDREQHTTIDKYELTLKTRDRLWMERPPQGSNATKFVYAWMGTMRIAVSADYDYFLIRSKDRNGMRREFIAHISFLATSNSPADELAVAAANMEVHLDHEGEVDDQDHDTINYWSNGGGMHVATAAAGNKLSRAATTNEAVWRDTRQQLVKVRRRRRRNQAGHYVL
ncbi:LOW QUALITY PROTEIN: hypothetical protein PHMEG_0003403 [Phytophthora megakarya]|uniref:Uncharacterized protein n=1 Tax=Phytophthora megakarya TaxID=4795 RepID=A0A225WY36_9STRA|nr:LOW QUALITY PROTEIN: hypothetical protein PHMEG_0003403 [Phytophthora megakarya]